MKISHEECLYHLNKDHLSFYEIRNGITGASTFNLVEAFQDIELWERQKSDGTHTFALVFKHGESWLYWVPTHNQVKILSEVLPKYYQNINEQNTKKQ